MTDSKQNSSKRRAWLRRGLREALVLAIVGLVAFSARSTLADHYHVPTGSMLPTIEIGDRIVVNKLAYGLRIPFTDVTLARLDEPANGEVIVLRSPVDGEVLLKRIIAVPGDLIAVRHGRLWLNGAAIPLEVDGGEIHELLGRHRHLVSFQAGGGPDLPATVMPPEHYLVMGDNRGNSLDGRSFGLVKRDAILGRTVAVFARGGRPTWRHF